MFRTSIASFQKQAVQDAAVEDAAHKASRFAEQYSRQLDALADNPWADIDGYGSARLDCVRLCRLREDCLRGVGFGDIYAAIKHSENAKALQLLPAVLRELDAEADDQKRLMKLLRGVFAGNIFDLGAAASVQRFEEAGASFLQTRESLLPQPWVIDHSARAIAWLHSLRYNKALLFVDNAGSDVVLGMLPLARELLRRGTQVVLAANSVHSINDITAAELQSVIGEAAGLDATIDRARAEGALRVVASGNDLPVIDLSRVSEELAAACDGVDLVILEGMGRAIETNLYAQLECDTLNLGMVKHPEVAQVLGGRLYDCVCLTKFGLSNSRARMLTI